MTLPWCREPSSNDRPTRSIRSPIINPSRSAPASSASSVDCSSSLLRARTLGTGIFDAVGVESLLERYLGAGASASIFSGADSIEAETPSDSDGVFAVPVWSLGGRGLEAGLPRVCLFWSCWILNCWASRINRICSKLIGPPPVDAGAANGLAGISEAELESVGFCESVMRLRLRVERNGKRSILSLAAAAKCSDGAPIF